MKRTRMSLKDILHEDSKSDVAEIQNENHDVLEDVNIVKSTEKTRSEDAVHLVNQNNEMIHNISEKGYSKSDFVKLSVTIEPSLFDAVDELSRNRRKRKLPYSYSEIVRDALKVYFGNKNSEI